jgi:hypothetical protein
LLRRGKVIARQGVDPFIELTRTTQKESNMVIIERQIQMVRSGKWTELEELDKKFTAVESRLGFPAKRRCRSLIGGLTTDALIIERQWESFAVLEATYEKALTNPEHQALSEEAALILGSQQIEFYVPLP